MEENNFSNLNFKELEEMCLELQKKATRAISTRQRLIDAKAELDEDLSRFKSIQEFGEKALQFGSIEAFGKYAVESISQTFNRPFCVMLNQVKAYEYKVLGVLGTDVFSFGDIIGIQPFKKILEGQYLPTLFSPEDLLLLKKKYDIDLHEAVFIPYYSKAQQLITIYVLGMPVHLSRFLNPINPKILSSLSIMVNAAGRILELIMYNELLKEEVTLRKKAEMQLEKRVQVRTRELEMANKKLQREIAERIIAEEQLAVRASELEQSNRSLEEFAYVTSHDLKSPLRNIISFTQLLERRLDNKFPDNTKEYFDFIVNNAKKLNQLINDLLAYSSAVKGQHPFEKVDLAEVIETVKTKLYHYLKENKAEIEYGKLPVLDSNVTLLEILFQNLIENAVKFQSEVAPRIQIKSRSNSYETVVSIKDNGIGIDPAFQEKIFLLFQRLHTDSSYEGSGIGLSVCKKVMEQHHGKIWLESMEGKGTTFFLSFPKDNKA